MSEFLENNLNIFYPCRNFESSYEINRLGQIKRVARMVRDRNGNYTRHLKSALIKPTIYNGYLRVNLYVDGIVHSKAVHRLIAETFIPNPENKPQVNHIDGNKLNNSIDNLEWVSNQENAIHAHRMGLTSSETRVECVELGLVFKSQADASRWLCGNVSKQSNISQVCKGKRITAYGYHWKFV